jgi:alpha-tubulin suppressor-like RCC1 family protein
MQLSGLRRAITVVVTTSAILGALVLPAPSQAAPSIVRMAAGTTQTCALLSTGGVQCWGGDDVGQLGDGQLSEPSSCIQSDPYNIYGSIPCRFTPADVVGISGVTQLSTLGTTTCAVLGGGVKCWGDNSSGALGDGTYNDSSTPVDVVGLSSGVSSVAATMHHSCAVLVSGGVKCWGDNSDGALGDGTTTSSPTPIDVVGLAGPAAAVSVSHFVSCAVLMSGSVQCWGRNVYMGLGNGGPYTSPGDPCDPPLNCSLTPVDVLGLVGPVTAISGSRYGACVVVADGRVECWGANYYGSLGNGTSSVRDGHIADGATAVEAVGISNAVQVATDLFHTCALLATGDVKCWGLNYFGELGDGTTVDSLVPVDVAGLPPNVVSITVGLYHTCAVLSTGAAKCWGHNDARQLGDGTTIDSPFPVDVAGFGGAAPDTVAPVVTGLPQSAANGNGWYAGPVTIHWSSNDPAPSSGTPSQPADTVAATEGASVAYTSASSCDPAGNCASGTLSLSIDLTAPTITPVVTPAPAGSGWNQAGAVVSFLCGDGLSGIASCTPALTLNADTAAAGTTVSGTATDLAGNSTQAGVVVKVDGTAPTASSPTLTYEPMPISTAIGIATNVSDALSGVAGAEFFVGADPGAGNGTPMTVSAGSATGSFTAPAAAGSVTVGVRSRDAAGNWSAPATRTVTVYNPLASSGTVTSPTGGTISSGSAPTLADPVTIAVTTAGAGAVTIAEAPAAAATGYTVGTEQVTVTAPAGTVANPLRLTFQLAASALPAGATPATLTVLRDGVAAPDCTSTTTATPDPCVLSRTAIAGGGVSVVILTSHASLWQFGQHQPFGFAGFYLPLLNPPLPNLVKAGSTVAVRFGLGGNQGLAVLASGYPKSQQITCGSSANVNGTDAAASSTSNLLSYDTKTKLYTFSWKTATTYSKAPAGPCRVLVLRLADGTYHRLLFRFG